MLGSTIQRELAMIIMREINDPRLDVMVSITRVSVSEDLSIADIYVTIMGTPGKQTAALNALKHSAGLLRTKLTKSLTIRQTPYLKFHYDERLKKELETLDLLERVRQEQEQTDRERAAKAAAEQPPGQEPEPTIVTEQPTVSEPPAVTEQPTATEPPTVSEQSNVIEQPNESANKPD